MTEELATYAAGELRVVQQLLKGFEVQFPDAAEQLGLSGGTGSDPHVERLIQAFTLIAARIHTKLDAALPEVATGLLRLIAPQYLAPFPAMSNAEFSLDPTQGKPTHGLSIPKGSLLTAKQDINGIACRFQTCYPLTLWPLHVVDARVETPDEPHNPMQRQDVQSLLTLTLTCTEGVTFADLALQHLRFYLRGPLPVATELYECLISQTAQIQFCRPGEHEPSQVLTLSPHGLRPVGFAPEEGLLPYASQTFMGYRLLLEYLAFPRKLLYFDLHEFNRVTEADWGDTLEIRFWLKQVPQCAHVLSAETFRLGCTPIVNLFPRRAEPIRVDQRQSEYPIIPDGAHMHAMEIYAINEVSSASATRAKSGDIAPFYGLKYPWTHHPPLAFWYDTRKPSPRPNDSGTDVNITLVDLDGQSSVPETETLIVKTLCTNRELPRELQIGQQKGDLDLEDIEGVACIRALESYTPPVRVPLGQNLIWRLISHLGSHYTSVFDRDADATKLRDTLRELLSLHDIRGAHNKQIEGISSIASRCVIRSVRLTEPAWHSVCRGTEITIQFDETSYTKGECFLFASVLERFFGLSAPLNSFSQLVATTNQRLAQHKEPLQIWEPRAGA